MRIIRTYLREGLFERNIEWSPAVNLVFSEKNTCGKKQEAAPIYKAAILFYTAVHRNYATSRSTCHHNADICGAYRCAELKRYVHRLHTAFP